MIHSQHKYCLGCGYDLRGNTSQACPECGRTFDPRNLLTFRRPGHRKAQLTRLLPAIAIAGFVVAALLSFWISPAFIVGYFVLAGGIVFVLSVTDVVTGGKMIERRNGRRKLREYDWPKRRF